MIVKEMLDRIEEEQNKEGETMKQWRYREISNMVLRHTSMYLKRHIRWYPARRVDREMERLKTRMRELELLINSLHKDSGE